jgi:hypothetical protein
LGFLAPPRASKSHMNRWLLRAVCVLIQH